MTIPGHVAAWLRRYLTAGDPFARAANLGAFIVWSNQPFYPLYVAWIVGWSQAGPSLLTWLSTPFFMAVPVLGRRYPMAGRCLFPIAGTANTLLALKAFGPSCGIGWFIVPCLIAATGLFRLREWRVSTALVFAIALCAVASPLLGAPLHAYGADQSRGLAALNHVSVTGLTLWLLISAMRLRLSAENEQPQEKPRNDGADHG